MPQSADKPARVAIYQSDAEGRCTYVNSVLCDLFEISEKEALGTGWIDRVHPSDQARVHAARPHAISPVPVFHLDYRLRTSKGTIWVAAFSTALVENGVFKGRIGIITDITEAKKHEATDRSIGPKIS